MKRINKEDVIRLSAEIQALRLQTVALELQLDRLLNGEAEPEKVAEPEEFIAASPVLPPKPMRKKRGTSIKPIESDPPRKRRKGEYSGAVLERMWRLHEVILAYEGRPFSVAKLRENQFSDWVSYDLHNTLQHLKAQGLVQKVGLLRGVWQAVPTSAAGKRRMLAPFEVRQ